MAMGILLVVEDYPPLLRAWIRAAKGVFEPRTAASVADAMRAIDAVDPADLRGAIIDLWLPDGSGLPVVAHCRERSPHAAIVIHTAHSLDESAVTNMGASVVYKWDKRFGARDVLNRIASHASRPAATRDEAVELIAKTYKHRVHSTELVHAIASGVPRDHLARTLGVSENTIKTRLRRLSGTTPGLPRLRTFEQVRTLVLRIIERGPDALAAEVNPSGVHFVDEVNPARVHSR